jgi:hypothetical protein
MDYTVFIDKVNGLSRDDEFKFTYKSKEYKFKCFDKSERFGNSFSVSNGVFSSMNVDKITKQYVTLYDFNMMSQRTTYKMAIDEMELVVEETVDIPGFEGTMEALDNLSIFQ